MAIDRHPIETVACVWIPHFAVRVELLRRPELDGSPVVLHGASGESASGKLVVDCSLEAETGGVRIGMAVREVLAVCPQATVLTSDPVRYARAFEELLTALQQIGPTVEPAQLGCAFLDLRGLLPLYTSSLPGLDGLLTALREVLPPFLRPRIGIGTGKFIARVAAERARAGDALVIPAEHTAGFLRSLPVSILAGVPVSAEMLRRLDLFGIRTLGELVALPRHAVQAQFGKEGARVWDLASGRDNEPVVGRRWEDIIRETLSFPAPATSLQTLVIGVERLAARALRQLELRGRNVRQIRLRAAIEGGRSWERTFTLREPTALLPRLVFAIKSRLDGLEMPGPVEELSLEFTAYGGEAGKQSQLFTTLSAERLRQLEEAIRQLATRFGSVSPPTESPLTESVERTGERTGGPIARVVELEPWSRLPERRHALIDYEP